MKCIFRPTNLRQGGARNRGVRQACPMQYKPFLAGHYNKDKTGITDTMYRNESILMDEIRAASRVMELAETLYRVSPVRSGVMDTADRWDCMGLPGESGN